MPAQGAAANPAETGFAAALSRWTHRYRWPVLGVWLFALLLAATGALSIGNVLSGGGWYVTGTQSDRAANELAKADMLGRGQIAVELVVHDQRYSASDPTFGLRAREVVSQVRSDPALKVSSTYGWTTLSPAARGSFLGKDQRTTLTAVALGVDDGTARRELAGINQHLAAQFRPQGLQVSLVGDSSYWSEVNTLSQQDLVIAEVITFPLIALILLLLYRSVAAAATSLVVGGTAIVFTLGALSPLAHHIELSIFLENAASMLGLGVAVDYSLFVVSRFQEELRRGRTVQEAVAYSMRYAGHTVFFSGLTVVATMATVFTVPLNVIQSLALGAVVVVAFAVLVATIILPALLHVLGHRINWGYLRFPARLRARNAQRRASSTGRWHRYAMAIMRRPVTWGVLGIILLAALALPVGGLRIFAPDARILPESSPVRTGYDLIQQQFGTGTPSPVQIVVHSRNLAAPEQESELVSLNDSLARLPHVASTQSVVTTLRQVNPTDPLRALQPGVFNHLPSDIQQTVQHYLSADQRTTVIELTPTGQASDQSSTDLVNSAQRVVASFPQRGFSAVVGGETSEDIDADNVIQNHLPTVVGLMLAVVFVLLLVTFRSLLLPLKAVAMNLLSLAATYGLLVAVFQRGIGANLLHMDVTGYLQNFVPILLLALLFSLSTDYEVFLLNRVRENYLRSGDNKSAVAEGIQSTGPLISGAAILMVAVFGAFGATGLVPIQQLGFGLAVAILLDATVVRLVLVPAAMRLLGRWNWWLPGFRTHLPASETEPQPVNEAAL